MDHQRITRSARKALPNRLERLPDGVYKRRADCVSLTDCRKRRRRLTSPTRRPRNEHTELTITVKEEEPEPEPELFVALPPPEPLSPTTLKAISLFRINQEKELQIGAEIEKAVAEGSVKEENELDFKPFPMALALESDSEDVALSPKRRFTENAKVLGFVTENGEVLGFGAENKSGLSRFDATESPLREFCIGKKGETKGLRNNFPRCLKSGSRLAAFFRSTVGAVDGDIEETLSLKQGKGFGSDFSGANESAKVGLPTKFPGKRKVSLSPRSQLKLLEASSNNSYRRLMPFCSELTKKFDDVADEMLPDPMESSLKEEQEPKTEFCDFGNGTSESCKDKLDSTEPRSSPDGRSKSRETNEAALTEQSNGMPKQVNGNCNVTGETSLRIMKCKGNGAFRRAERKSILQKHNPNGIEANSFLRTQYRIKDILLSKRSVSSQDMYLARLLEKPTCVLSNETSEAEINLPKASTETDSQKQQLHTRQSVELSKSEKDAQTGGDGISHSKFSQCLSPERMPNQTTSGTCNEEFVSPPPSLTVCNDPFFYKVKDDTTPTMNTPGSVPSKGILKMSPCACKGLCCCPECASFRSNAEKAADFAERQLSEAEALVMPLVNELSSVRGLMEKFLQDEAVGSQQFHWDVKEATDKVSQVKDAALSELKKMSNEVGEHCKNLRSQQRRVKFDRAVKVSSKI